jgi:hypothetical protein
MNEVKYDREDSALVEDPRADLEMMYIGQYLHEKGYSVRQLDTLPEEAAARLMTEASQYASLKLAELESRARLRKQIDRVADSL